MIAFKHVSKKYQGERVALDDINVTVEKGSIVSVIGPSGAGKTSLIRCINRLIDCSSGDVEIDGESVMKARRRTLMRLRKKTGMIFQNCNLVERLTVIENVLHGCLGGLPLYRSLLGAYPHAAKEQAMHILEEVGLERHAYRCCRNLSGGQKQRVGIARALMQNPEILLCDEPVSALDPKTSENILDYLEAIIKTHNLTCVMNLHHVEYAKRYSDRIIGLQDGSIVFDGKPAELSCEILTRIFSA